MEHIIWNGFNGNLWKEEINVSDFIKQNYKEYLGDASFLAKATPRTNAMMEKVQALFKLERQKGGVLDIDTEHVSGINNFLPGYIDKENEVIVGLQTDEPLKRIMNPFGGMRMVKNSLKAYDYKMNSDIEK